ncbi:MAG TPA: DUF3386 family protein [Pirellulales bacterium]
MRNLIRGIGGCGLYAALALLAPHAAEAHFLFIHVTPPAEGGRAAEVFFSERATAGDPRFVKKVAHTELWRQASPGKFEPLEVRIDDDRLRAHLPAAGSIAVTGFCEYGVLARPNETPFLLRYYPKAVAGKPDELNRFERRPNAALEIMATVEGSHVNLVALADGRALPSVVFHVVDSDLTEEEITAADGRARWSPGKHGRWSIYVKHVLPTAGEKNGQHYEEIRQFATLALTWPLAPDEPDVAAVERFEDAVAIRAQWRGFPGFTAKLAGSVAGRSCSGDVTVAADGGVTLNTDDAAAREWLEEQLGSIVMHRAASDRPKGARPRLWFGDDENDDHPLGRLLIFDGGAFASSYRVKDRQITVVNRSLGRRNMTITVLDNQQTPEGTFLPRSYTVHYWDDATGRLTRSEAIDDRWTRVGGFDLPRSHTVTTSSDAGQNVRSFTLSEHALLPR